MARSRSRKWIFVAQEARRLAALGLPRQAIATKIGVDQSTVARWMTAGKIPSTRRLRPGRVRVRPLSWAEAVRTTYALDATDEELVRLAVAALALARDRKQKPALQLHAMGRFQALITQLRLVARPPLEAAIPSPAPALEPAAARPARLDPRARLMADAPKAIQ